ncbi:MAG TPA: hypothetical protein VND23_01690 [Acidimicrobiales bacterium]|nr:hypothetical protein [Acidimicrobiales bacterium]
MTTAARAGTGPSAADVGANAVDPGPLARTWPASSKVRGQMNRAIFEEILVEVDGSVIYARMTQPFAAFHLRDEPRTSRGPGFEHRRSGGVAFPVFEPGSVV